MRRAIALSVAGAALCLAVIAGPASAAPRELFGISRGQPLNQRDFNKLEATPVRTLRFAINWYAVQPRNAPPAFGRCWVYWSTAGGLAKAAVAGAAIKATMAASEIRRPRRYPDRTLLSPTYPNLCPG